MEAKEMKIQVPEGYEIDREKSTFEIIVFRKVEAEELPKSWEGLKIIDGFFVSNLGYIEKVSDNIVKREYECRYKVLAFKTEELRDEFLKNFRELIWIAKPLL